MYHARMGVINAGITMSSLMEGHDRPNTKAKAKGEEEEEEEKKRRSERDEMEKEEGITQTGKVPNRKRRLPNRGRLHHALTRTGNSARRCREVRNDSIKKYTCRQNNMGEVYEKYMHMNENNLTE